MRIALLQTAQRRRGAADAAIAGLRVVLEGNAAREAARMPEQNGIRRPKPDGLCGKAWKIFDDVSAKNGSPASIAVPPTRWPAFLSISALPIAREPAPDLLPFGPPAAC